MKKASHMNSRALSRWLRSESDRHNLGPVGGFYRACIIQLQA